MTETQDDTVAKTVLLFLGSTVLQIISPTDPAAFKMAILKAILPTFTQKLNSECQTAHIYTNTVPEKQLKDGCRFHKSGTLSGTWMEHKSGSGEAKSLPL